MTLPAPRRRTSLSLILYLSVYLLGLLGLGGYLFWPRSEPIPLRVTSARLAPEGDRILVEGEGFGPGTQVSLALDLTNRRQLRHSVPTWGSGGEMVRVGRHAYALVQKKGLLILDLSEPLRPQPLSTLTLQEWMRAIAVENGIAYIACDQAGLVLVDIRDPSAPQRLGSLPELVGAQGLAIRDGQLYAAVTARGGSKALAVVDIANPRQPRLLGRVPLPGQPLGVTLWRDRLLVSAGKAGLVEMTLGEGLPRVKSRLELPGIAHTLVVAKDQAYVACALGGLVMVDLSGEGPRLSPHPAFEFHAIRLVHETDRLYLRGKDGQVQVFDLKRPEQPRWLGSIDASFGAGLVALERTVYHNTRSRGLQVLDLTEPTSPQHARPMFGAEEVRAVALEENLLLVSTQAGNLHLLERGEGGAAQRLATFPLQGPSSFFRIHAGYVYAQTDKQGLEVVDVRNPRLPVAVGGDPVAWPQLGFAIEPGSLAFSPRGNLGAFVNGSKKLMLFDAASPDQLELRPGPQLPEGIYALVWGEDCLYAAMQGSNKIIPIASPASQSARVYPALALPTQTIREIALIGQVMVVACGLEGLITINFSNPAAPRLLAIQPLPINADFLSLVGTTAHVADARGGLMQLDLSDPARPRSTGLLVETGGMEGLAVAGTQAFLAGRTAGLQVIPLPRSLQPLSRDARQISLALPPIDTPGHYSLRVTDGAQSVALPGVLALAPP